MPNGVTVSLSSLCRDVLLLAAAIALPAAAQPSPPAPPDAETLKLVQTCGVAGVIVAATPLQSVLLTHIETSSTTGDAALLVEARYALYFA